MYEKFYGLSAKPFQLRPDPNFYFGSKGHKRAASYLEYGLSQEEGFIVITGEIGAGKTTLLRNLFRKLQSKNIVAAQIVNTSLDSEDILRMVAVAFGLPSKDASKATLLTRIELFLRECDRQGKRVLLLVDEAQNLTPHSVEELRMLSNFQTADKSLLQTFLLGQPEFRKTLLGEDMKQLQQRVIATYHLGPMDAPETQSYIEHRLHTVGWQGDPSFSQEAFAAIYDFTSGIPRQINTLCDRLLLMGYLEKIHEFGKPEIDAVISDIQQEFVLPPTEEDRAEDSHIKLESLDARLSKLEHSVSSILELLKQILMSSIKNLPKDKN
ncbi:MAG: AAA family ATPase [Nitrosomonadales bacterium]|nr:AAA family ATPase [Nitrosomonadales bacterium]